MTLVSVSTRRLASGAANAARVISERNPTSLSTLSNGLRVASQAGPTHQGTAVLTVSVAAGTRHEGDNSTGAAHALEHLFFKGTESRSQAEFDSVVESIGANVQACTSREITQFTVSMPAEKLDEGFNLLSDVLLKPRLDEAALQREKEVIDQEWDFVMKQYPEENLYDHLHAIAFNKKSGLGFNILGDDRSYRSLNREHLVDYRDANYVAPKMVVSVSGVPDHAKVAELADKYFGSVPSEAPRGLIAHAPSSVDWQGGEVRVHDDDMPHLAAALAWQGPGAAHEDTVPMIVLQGMFSSYAANTPGAAHTHNKFGQATMNHGVEGPIQAESVDFFSVPYSDVSLVGLQLRSKPGIGVEELVYHEMTELVKTAFEVSESDLTRGKNNIRGMITSMGSSARGSSEGIGKEILYYGRTVPQEEIAARLDAVTAGDIQNVVSKYIYDRCPAVAIIGKEADYFPEYNRCRSWTYFLLEAGGSGMGGATSAGEATEPSAAVVSNARRS